MPRPIGMHVSCALLSLPWVSESRALQPIPGGFDTEAVASGNLGPGNPSVYEPTSPPTRSRRA